jgi:poly-gamma-glutamate capsule biosynthesis protein CapA/YwtB (metallophosphatase superfamily)
MHSLNCLPKIPKSLAAACLFLVVLLPVSACDARGAASDLQLPTAGSSQVSKDLPAPGITVTKVNVAEADEALPSTPPAMPTGAPEVRLFVPGYLKDNVAVAIQDLAAAGNPYSWRFADSRDEADVLLEPGEEGVPAGYRAIALTVPFDSPLDDISAQQAETIASAGNDDVTSIDWALMPVQRKALRVEALLPAEEGYPLRQNWSLLPAEGYEPAADALAAHLRDTLYRDQLIQLSAVGDLMLDRSLGRALENGDLAFPFAGLNGVLRPADITLGNLESALGDLGQPENKSYTFQAPPSAAEALAAAGFDLVSLANNHAMDYGPQGLQQTIELLQQANIATVGAGANDLAARTPVLFELGGLKVAFLSYVSVPVEVTGFDAHGWAATSQQPGVAWADEYQIRQDVASASSEYDLVVVLLHSGYEYIEAPSPEQMTAARAAIDAGADLVIGHHAHVLQGIEFRGSAVIAYGLGNFAFEIDGDSSTMILNVWLDSDGVRQFELVPAFLEAGGRPRLATDSEASEIRQRVYWLSAMISDTQ